MRASRESLAILASLIVWMVLTSAWAGSSLPCEAGDWPYARKQSKVDLHRTFEEMERRQVFRYFLGELTGPRERSTELARAMETYLVGTEGNADLRAFFKLLGEASSLHDKSATAVRKIPISEVCSILSKIKG